MSPKILSALHKNELTSFVRGRWWSRLALDGGSARRGDELVPNEPALVLEDERHDQDAEDDSADKGTDCANDGPLVVAL